MKVRAIGSTVIALMVVIPMTLAPSLAHAADPPRADDQHIPRRIRVASRDELVAQHEILIVLVQIADRSSREREIVEKMPQKVFEDLRSPARLHWPPDPARGQA